VKFNCEFCGEPVSNVDDSAYRRVVGWVGKTTKTMMLASAPTGWAHKVCLDIERLHRRKKQDESLF
jgi:hypothetical protein